VARYLEFPPRTQFIEHAPFSWVAFVLFGALALLAFAGLVYLLLPRGAVAAQSRVTPGPFPWWGWLAVLRLGLCWLLAWSRFAWFRPFQAHTFTPLWLSYILFVNALTYRRVGRCLVTHWPRFFLALFPLSALFWWYFEYLNRFVQNWHYIGIETFGPLTYAIHATLAFATVLPAVLSTTEWLRSYPALGAHRFRLAVQVQNRRLAAAAALLAAGAGLLFLGVWPDYLFPLLWIAPLVLIVALQVLRGEPTVFAPLARGNWRIVALPALAALLCGLLWEMWNAYSYARWVYTVPFVQGFEIFEMPLLGYAGYLPFGLECVVIAGLLKSDWFRVTFGDGVAETGTG
jgi:hypothetical protein